VAAPANLSLDSVFALNNSGIAVGSVGGRAAEASLSSSSLILLALPGYSFATAINDAGQVAGTYLDLQGHSHAFYWSPADGAIMLGSLGGSMSIATGINGSGQVVGQTADATGRLSAFVWSLGGGMWRIGDDASEDAIAINNSGMIAYVQDPSPYHTQFGAVGSRSDPVVLNFSGQGSSISGMNNLGWIVGRTVGGDGFLWMPNGSVDFGSSFLPAAINDLGEVVGRYQGQAAVWTRSGGIQLLDLGGHCGVTLTGINDAGQIVGDFAAPEPSGLVLFGGGAALLAAGWRKRRQGTGSGLLFVVRGSGGRSQRKTQARRDVWT